MMKKGMEEETLAKTQRRKESTTDEGRVEKGGTVASGEGLGFSYGAKRWTGMGQAPRFRAVVVHQGNGLGVAVANAR